MTTSHSTPTEETDCCKISRLQRTPGLLRRRTMTLTAAASSSCLRVPHSRLLSMRGAPAGLLPRRPGNQDSRSDLDGGEWHTQTAEGVGAMAGVMSSARCQEAQAAAHMAAQETASRGMPYESEHAVGGLLFSKIAISRMTPSACTTAMCGGSAAAAPPPSASPAPPFHGLCSCGNKPRRGCSPAASAASIASR